MADMDFGRLGSILGQSLGLNEKLQRTDQQRQMVEMQKQAMIQQKAEQEAAIAAQKQAKSQLFNELLSGSYQGQPIDQEQAMVVAAQSGFSPQEQSLLQRGYAKRDEQAFKKERANVKDQLERDKMAQRREEFEANRGLRKESIENQALAPQRKKIADQIALNNTRAEIARRRIGDYDALIKLAESDELTTGTGKRALAAIGLPDFFNTPADDLASKLIADMGIAEASGAVSNFTDTKFKEGIKSNPSLLQTKTGLIESARLKKLVDQANLIIEKQQNKLLEDIGDKPVPPTFMAKLSRKTKTKLEKIHKQQDKLVDRILNQKVGSKESSKNIPFKDLPSASEYKNRFIRDKKTGELFRSDGSEWKPYNSSNV